MSSIFAERKHFRAVFECENGAYFFFYIIYFIVIISCLNFNTDQQCSVYNKILVLAYTRRYRILFQTEVYGEYNNRYLRATNGVFVKSMQGILNNNICLKCIVKARAYAICKCLRRRDRYNTIWD